MINYCSYKYNPIKQDLEKASASLTPQTLIPFDNISKKGWCDFHKRWELITIMPDNSMFFSCGLRLPSNIGLNKNWNKNQYEFIVDTDNFVIRVNERWTWIDVYEKEIYSTQKVYSKIIDFNRGIISHPKNFNIVELDPAIYKKIMDLTLSLCKRKYGIELHVENPPLKDFIKYPCCPEFNLIENKVDNVKNFNFRADLNLFKDFCLLVQVKETKSLRKDFHKNPELIFLHAMAQYLGFTNTDATRIFVLDEEMYRIFVEENRLRFSIKNRSVYINLEEGNDTKVVLNGLRLWVQNARTDKSDSVIVKRLIKFFKDTDLNVIYDAVDLYYKNARNLPVAFHERILKEGFTNQMHDQLMHYFAVDDDNNTFGYKSSEQKVTNKVIEYDKDVIRFEDYVEDIAEEFLKKDYESIKENRLMMLKAEKQQINDSRLKSAEENLVSDDIEDDNLDNFDDLEDMFVYEKIEAEASSKVADFEIGKDLMKRSPAKSYFFALPKNTDELYEISTHMRNCVGYLYRNKVISKESIIVVLIKDNKMKACIEIKQDKKSFHYFIKQALGPGNACINRKYCTAIEEWKNRHNIEGEVNYKL